MAFYTSEKKYSAQANLGWQSQHRLSKPLDFSYKLCLFFFHYKDVIEMICFVDVSHSVASILCLRLVYPIDGTVCICAWLYLQYIPESVMLVSDNSFFISAFCVLHFPAENDVFYKFHSNKHEGNLLVAVGPLNQYLVIREEGEDILKMFEWLPKMHILI